MVLNHNYDPKCTMANDIIEKIENDAQVSEQDELDQPELEFTVKNYFVDGADSKEVVENHFDLDDPSILATQAKFKLDNLLNDKEVFDLLGQE